MASFNYLNCEHSFTLLYWKARKGRNPKTGEEIKIKSMHVVQFKPSKGLKVAVR